MGTSATPKVLVGKLTTYADAVGNVNRTALNAAALAVKEVTLAKVAAATGGDLKISGVKSKASPSGAKVGVRYRISGNEDAKALIFATGPAQFIESDMPEHLVVSKYGPKAASGRVLKSGKLSKAKTRKAALDAIRGGGSVTGWTSRAVISFGNVTVRYSTKAGGSKGRKPYAKGFEEGAEVSVNVYAKKQGEVMTSVFR